MSEADYLSEVIRQAHQLRLLVHHQITRCWKCGQVIGGPETGDSGFPDLLAVGPAGAAAIELKWGLGRLNRDQRRWETRLTGGPVPLHYAVFTGPADLVDDKATPLLRAIA